MARSAGCLNCFRRYISRLVPSNQKYPIRGKSSPALLPGYLYPLILTHPLVQGREGRNKDRFRYWRRLL